MGNLVRKPAQVLLNTVDADSLTYSSGEGLQIKDYNFFPEDVEVIKFLKASTVAGTNKVVTVTPVIAYPVSAQAGAELLVDIKQVPDILGGTGAGGADNFHLAYKTFQGYLPTLAPANAGYLADADYQALVDQIVTAINSDPYLKGKIVASRSTNDLVLTGQGLFNFEVRIGQQYGTMALTTPYVSPQITLADVQRIFPIKPMQVGYPTDIYPDPTVNDWSMYKFKIKRKGYALDGANHADEVFEEVEFYVPTALAEATNGANWDNEIYLYLTAISYVDPQGVASPWDLVYVV